MNDHITIDVSKIVWFHADDCPTLNDLLPGSWDDLCNCEPVGYTYAGQRYVWNREGAS